MPELRRAYLPFPLPHFYQFGQSVACIAVERSFGCERSVMGLLIKNPAGQKLAEIAKAVRHAATAPVEEIKDFKRILTVGRLPLPLRRAILWLALAIGRLRGNYFGTFGISAVSGLGTDVSHPISPFGFLLNYGVISTGGQVDVRLVFDHRIVDGAQVARALQRLEQILLGPMLVEVRLMEAGESHLAPNQFGPGW